MDIRLNLYLTQSSMFYEYTSYSKGEDRSAGGL
jgi:hypothetical protein